MKGFHLTPLYKANKMPCRAFWKYLINSTAFSDILDTHELHKKAQSDTKKNYQVVYYETVHVECSSRSVRSGTEKNSKATQQVDVQLEGAALEWPTCRDTELWRPPQKLRPVSPPAITLTLFAPQTCRASLWLSRPPRCIHMLLLFTIELMTFVLLTRASLRPFAV